MTTDLHACWERGLVGYRNGRALHHPGHGGRVLCEGWGSGWHAAQAKAAKRGNPFPAGDGAHTADAACGVPPYLACPFCWEDDFDQVGLKGHLTNGWCEPYKDLDVRPAPLSAAAAADETGVLRVNNAELRAVLESEAPCTCRPNGLGPGKPLRCLRCRLLHPQESDPMRDGTQ